MLSYFHSQQMCCAVYVLLINYKFIMPTEYKIEQQCAFKKLSLF